MSDRVPPSWVRILDGVGVGCLLISVLVMMTGGGHQSTLFGRVSLTSWLRPAAIGIVVLIARHWLYRQPSLAFRVWAGLREWRSSPESRSVWPVFLSTRIAVAIVAFFGIALLGNAPNTPPWRFHDNELLNLPARWDAGWYLGIAEHGYQWDPARAREMQNIAFFPAYPMLIRYGALPLAGGQLVTGTLISFVAFFFALKYVFRLARQAIGEDGAATAVTLLAAYPFAFYFSAVYTESLFLLAAAATCYHFERSELGRAAIWGLTAGLVRPNGCLLSIVLAIMVLRQYRALNGQALAVRLVVAAMPGIGLLIFSAYIYSLTGNPLQWADNHAAYGRSYRSLWALVDDRIRYVQANGFYNYVTVLSVDVVNVVPTLFALASVWPVYQRLGAPYAAMILLNVLLPLHMGGVLSIGRMTSVMFPIFLWLGAAIVPRHRASWVMSFAMLQALLAIAFFTWRPLY